MYLPPLLNRRTDPDEILGGAPFGRRTDPRLPGDPGSPPPGVPPLLKGRGDFSGKGPLSQSGGRGGGWSWMAPPAGPVPAVWWGEGGVGQWDGMASAACPLPALGVLF